MRETATWGRLRSCVVVPIDAAYMTDDDDDEIAYFTVRWKTTASFVYRTKTSDNTDKDSKNRKRPH